MKKRNSKKNKKVLMLLVILLAVSVGFALLSVTLKINGTAGVKGNTWDIHWENVVPNGNSTVTTEDPVIGDNGTSVTYDVELALPGDFYEFTVDAVNDGSINAKIEDIRHTVKQVTIVNEEEVETDATLPSYILYSVVYDGTNTAPAEGDLLGAHTSKTYKVRIEYDPLATTVPENDLVYRITDEFDYEQTKEIDIQGILANIEANPNAYRNQDQDPTNLDIGVDKYGNVINLDWFVDQDQCAGEKVYTIDTNTNEILIGGKDDEGGCRSVANTMYYTGATSAANVVDGKWQLTIPEYIYDDATNKFYPVTELGFFFTNTGGGPSLTEMPEIPETITTIGQAVFIGSRFTSVVIPKQVETIKYQAFHGAFDYQGVNNTLTFENGSQLKTIGGEAFKYDNISGNLILPQTVESIDTNAFTFNNLTSVTFPSTTTVDNNAFDAGVTINHTY